MQEITYSIHISIIFYVFYKKNGSTHRANWHGGKRLNNIVCIPFVSGGYVGKLHHSRGSESHFAKDNSAL